MLLLRGKGVEYAFHMLIAEQHPYRVFDGFIQDFREMMMHQPAFGISVRVHVVSPRPWSGWFVMACSSVSVTPWMTYPQQPSV